MRAAICMVFEVSFRYQTYEDQSWMKSKAQTDLLLRFTKPARDPQTFKISKIYIALLFSSSIHFH